MKTSSLGAKTTTMLPRGERPLTIKMKIKNCRVPFRVTMVLNVKILKHPASLRVTHASQLYVRTQLKRPNGRAAKKEESEIT